MDLSAALIRTEALRLAPAGQPYYYTSGTLGPYYINTHFLFGGPGPAGELLEFIDAESRAEDFHPRLAARVEAQLEADEGYREVVEALADEVRRRQGCEWISGGERRDWFFSLGVARLLERPHLYIYKDHALRLAEGDRARGVERLETSTAHVADLVTEASSYERDWIPALRDAGGDMALAANVVDRAQGGLNRIRDAGVEAVALLRVDEALFETLYERGEIDADQRRLLVDYHRDPSGSMRGFLQQNPDFLKASLKAEDERTAERARRLVDSDIYGLGGTTP